ncbi:pentatricopeptide repeat-containing protein At3g24000, mitochondrial-like [Cryptomeria japonica]|uniref:pentatricopeptide repeat-containing protein At3g24000, mitochondrial-like n=1 Tax=Cryptomeria japonica TaxID=3369 RepID=UPI0027DAA806|nr:pentatricopeptide repeat-containing protein At3g24000, mitochondrial-like [Cryptomeria japonica]
MSVLSSTNLKLTALGREGRLKEALHILLTSYDPPRDTSTYLQLLEACNIKNALSQGKQIHSLIINWGFAFAKCRFFQTKLVNMYVKCGRLVDARKEFDDMTERDGFSWNAIIAAYRRHGYPHEALTLFHQMQRTGVQPDRFTFATILPACAKIRALEQGMDMHGSIIERGILSDVVVVNALVDMYAKCGSINKARELFDKIPHKNEVSWNAMIAGYTQNGDLDEALRLFNKMPRPDIVSWNAMVTGYVQNGLVEKALDAFKQMHLADLKPNSTTFSSILSACAEMGGLEQGIKIHQFIIESGFLSEVVVVNALIDMYVKCGSIPKARQLFDKMPQRDVVTWTAMIAGYAQSGFLEKALENFKQMQSAGFKPDSTTFASILPACSKLGGLEQGMDIHKSIIENGYLSDVVLASILVDMYAKCGSIKKASMIFDKMHQRNIVSWNTMIAGYAQNGFSEKALQTFKQVQSAGLKPDSTTFVSILPACAKLGSLEQGMDIHQSIIESEYLSDVIVVNALIDMYAKCGSIQKARKLFDKMPQRNVISWNAMVAGYAQNGFCIDALKLFEQMKQSGTYPDHVSFACVLFACSHAGLVDEGCKYFNSMSDCSCIMPTIDHYVRMVDVLCRAGYLEETLNFIIKMPIKPTVVVWTSLLGACRSHKNITLGEFTANLLLELDPNNPAIYVLLSNIYADVGRWGDVQMVRRLMKNGEIKKIPGCSWIEDQKILHAFCVGDRSHPQTQEIYAKLEKLSWEMKVEGYLQDSRHLQDDVEEEEKELFNYHHSEKLAIAFGLLNTPPGTTIRVVKNLRVCVDCHNATKFISKIVGRQIVVRDANRFHHFKQGQCSCGDYW